MPSPSACCATACRWRAPYAGLPAYYPPGYHVLLATLVGGLGISPADAAGILFLALLPVLGIGTYLLADRLTGPAVGRRPRRRHHAVRRARTTSTRSGSGSTACSWADRPPGQPIRATSCSRSSPSPPMPSSAPWSRVPKAGGWVAWAGVAGLLLGGAALVQVQLLLPIPLALAATALAVAVRDPAPAQASGCRARDLRADRGGHGRPLAPRHPGRHPPERWRRARLVGPARACPLRVLELPARVRAPPAARAPGRRRDAAVPPPAGRAAADGRAGPVETRAPRGWGPARDVVGPAVRAGRPLRPVLAPRGCAPAAAPLAHRLAAPGDPRRGRPGDRGRARAARPAPALGGPDGRGGHARGDGPRHRTPPPRSWPGRGPAMPTRCSTASRTGSHTSTRSSVAPGRARRSSRPEDWSALAWFETGLPVVAIVPPGYAKLAFDPARFTHRLAAGSAGGAGGGLVGRHRRTRRGRRPVRRGADRHPSRRGSLGAPGSRCGGRRIGGSDRRPSAGRSSRATGGTRSPWTGGERLVLPVGAAGPVDVGVRVARPGGDEAADASTRARPAGDGLAEGRERRHHRHRARDRRLGARERLGDAAARANASRSRPISPAVVQSVTGWIPRPDAPPGWRVASETDEAIVLERAP